jgi:hypothetical protein
VNFKVQANGPAINVHLQIPISKARVCNNGGDIDLKDFEEVVVVCIDTTWFL